MSAPATFSAANRSHPLELIPFFRRFPCSRSRNLLYTFIWNVLMGAVFLAASAALGGRLPGARGMWTYFVIANFIGFAIHALLEAGAMLGLEARVQGRGFAVKLLYYTALPMLGVIAGFQAADWTLDIGFGDWLVNRGWIISIVATSFVISFVLSVVFYLREREARAQAQYEHERLRVERVEREAALANLRALQAQIEPHFLFNTLANATSLVDSDAPKAKRMLESFIRFLRASLAATRAESTTLGAESELIAAYLDVLQVRMGERLRYAVGIPHELRGWTLAPMLLQPLVENAIRHGLEPKVEGGEIFLDARREGGDVVIEIRDSGIGFAATTRGGVGLANLRDRLSGMHGDRASLTIGDNPGGGTRVTIRLPA